MPKVNHLFEKLSIIFSELGESFRTHPYDQTERDKTFHYEAKVLDIPAETTSGAVMLVESERAIVHELIDPAELDVIPVYYISDIHICHQIDVNGKTKDEIKKQLDEKVKCLVKSLKTDRGVILICGDVADSVKLTQMFFHSLKSEMACQGYFEGWHVLAILGNHELWDGDPYGLKPIRPINNAVDAYRKALCKERVVFMHNELFVDYKRGDRRLVNEQTLLEVDDDDLRELLNDAIFITLGGMGFAGRNPRFNTTLGIYGLKPGFGGKLVPRLSRKEEIAQSERFRVLYDKMLRVASDKTVIVATHMPVSDWSSAQYNPNWVYINGHTHMNTLVRLEDGTTVLSDNQVGYKPKVWRFNAFTYQGRYNPFGRWCDGIYDITAGQYIGFNNGCGIGMCRFRWSGQIHMIKRSGTYMFFLEKKSLLMLAGGRRIKVDHNLQYYYDNLELYTQRVRMALEPYHRALMVISDEVKAFGGAGTTHGCIVDIDWGNHIYLNPFDGSVAPYFAWDMTNKLKFDSVETLLNESPCPPELPSGEQLTKRYEFAEKVGSLPILSAKDVSNKALATVPEVVLDRQMYDPSRIMRSVQYLFDQGVVRIWKDAVLEYDASEDRHLPAPVEKSHRGRPQKLNSRNS